MKLTREMLVHSIEASNLAHTIALVEDDLKLSYVNQAFLDLTGFERSEVIGQNCNMLQGSATNPETIEQIRGSLKHIQYLDTEILNYKKDGTPFWNRLRLSPIMDEETNDLRGFVGIQSDITGLHHQKRIESDRQKLEALGRFSANLSHEIKNALQPVLLMADTLKGWKQLSDQQIQMSLAILQENVEIADKISRSTLEYSAQSKEDSEEFNAKKFVEDALRFIQNLMHSRISFTYDIQDIEEDQSVMVEKSRFFQVLLNLINNAFDAMGNRGSFNVRVKTATLSGVDAAMKGVKNGKYLQFAFTDSGCGIEAKNLKTIFDPFFSTKTADNGTGLGLSIARQYIHEQGGSIIVDSRIGLGTTFTLYLPFYEKLTSE